MHKPIVNNSYYDSYENTNLNSDILNCRKQQLEKIREEKIRSNSKVMNAVA